MASRSAAEVVQVSGAASLGKDLIALTKPRLSSLVLCTTAAGLYFAKGELPLPRALLVLLATALLVAGAQSLNSAFERDVDARMDRTKERPIAARRLDVRIGVWLGFILAVVSLPVLFIAGNLVTALLGASAFISYVAVYTPLKRYSTLALPVGAIPGALPPAMGYTAVTGRFDLVALVLFGILFFWQLPHFLAISIYLREDYQKGGLKVFAVVHGEKAARLGIVLSTLALVPVTLLLVPLGVADQTYALAATVLGALFVGLSLVGVLRPNRPGWARTLFLGSLVYLPLLLVALLWSRP